MEIILRRPGCRLFTGMAGRSEQPIYMALHRRSQRQRQLLHYRSRLVSEESSDLLMNAKNRDVGRPLHEATCKNITDPPYQVEAINDGELLDFVKRTLAFTSRPLN
jgi:hypothetical protein